MDKCPSANRGRRNLITCDRVTELALVASSKRVLAVRALISKLLNDHCRLVPFEERNATRIRNCI